MPSHRENAYYKSGLWSDLYTKSVDDKLIDEDNKNKEGTASVVIVVKEVRKCSDKE